MEQTIPIDNQPIGAGFFEEGHWLSDYVTPDEPDILVLYRRITEGMDNSEDRIVACWDWVANKVRYKPHITAEIRVEGKASYQGDYWQSPSMVSKTQVGNCANKAFLLTSLLRNELSPAQVYCVLGNLYNGHVQGHAWVQINISGREYIVEATRNDVPMLDTNLAPRYESVHYFNDQQILAVPGRTVMTPFESCYSEWLKDYLNFNYINNGGAGALR
jgi:transglutaminase-like putative cysteine protease